MATSRPMMGTTRRSHWIVRMDYRVRTVSFGVSFVFIGAHLWGKDYSPIVWGLLILQFLIYPHLMYWRAQRAPVSLQAELNNLVVDSLLIGLWVAALQFPLWIGFTLFIGSSLNNTISRGTPGFLWAMLAFFSGALMSVALFGWHVAPATGWPVTLLCVIGLSAYLLLIGELAYGRNQKLRDARTQLRLNEQALQQQLDENRALQAQLSEQANRDPLTGLYNRRYLDVTLVRELARCEREGQRLSLMMIDIDHFKRVNDSYGHLAGDEFLKKLATMLNEQARVADVTCRFGGEEFLLLLPNVTQDVALVRAEQWRVAAAAMIVPFEEFRLQATLSIGIAIYPDHGRSPDELICCADQALYRAKTEGRNRVVLFGSETAVTGA